MARAPFDRMPFAELPAMPRVPHPYEHAPAETLTMTSRPFGELHIHYRTYGSGPPLLLIHGFMTSSYSFRYMLEPLGAHYTLYIPDLPGAGRSDKPLAPCYSAPAMAEWIGEFQRAVGIRGCKVLGNSMGGYLCMLLALQDPGAMASLVNLHSPGVPEARLYAAQVVMRIPGMNGLLRWLVHRDPLAWVHRNVHYYDETLKSLEEAHEYGDPLATDVGVRAFRKFLVETMAPGPMRALQHTLAARRAANEPFPIPLLLIYAERDPMVSPKIGTTFAAAIPSAQFEWLPEASHFAHVDAVDRLVPRLRAFWA